jgi:hypothetical protein
MTQRTISEQVFDHLPTFHTKILFRDFNAKLGREENLKLPIGKETLYKDSNDNGVTVWLQQIFHKPGTLLIKKFTIRLIVYYQRRYTETLIFQGH